MKKMKSVIQFLIFGIMIYFFIILGTKDYQTKVEDNVRFSNDYKDISRNNLFKYIGEHEVLDLFNGKSAILFMGFPSNIWSHYYADYLNEIAILNSIDTIYYYDFKRDRSMNNKTYNTIVTHLKEYLVMDDSGNMDIKAPTLVLLKNGQVVYYDDALAYLKGDIAPEDYFNETQKQRMKADLDRVIKEYLREDYAGRK